MGGLNLNKLASSQIDSSKVLERAHGNILKTISKRKDKEFIILQQFLQNQFYGDNKAVENLINKTIAALDNDYIKIKSFDKLTNFNIDEIENNAIDAKTKIEQYIDNKYSASSIRLKDIKNELKYIYSILNNLKNNTDSKKIEELRNKIDDIYNSSVKEIYNKLTKSNISEKALLENNQNLEGLVHGLNEMHNILQNFLGTKDGVKRLSPKDIGDIFEYGLAMCSQEFVNKTVDDIKNDVIPQITDVVTGYVKAGSTKSIVAGGKNSNIQTDFKLDVSEYKSTIAKTTKKGKVSEYEIVISENPHITIKVKSDGKTNFDIKKVEQKNGKMDVLYTLPNSKYKSFRVSAKNWSTTKSTKDKVRGFETQSLAYSIERTINRTNFYGYIFQIGNDTNHNDIANINLWHQIGKMSVISDALIGTTQSEGFADTLVINDRAKSLIIVIPMRTVIEEMSKLIIDDSNFEGYDSDNITNALQGIFKLHDKNGISGTNKIMSGRQYLNSLAVKLKYDAIKQFAIPKQ